MDGDIAETTTNDLTSTMGSVQSNTNENIDDPPPAVDSVPSSSSDATNAEKTLTNKITDDSISSTSDVGDRSMNMGKTNIEDEAELFANECNISYVATEKITENVEDIVTDLENLLGEPSEFTTPDKEKVEKNDLWFDAESTDAKKKEKKCGTIKDEMMESTKSNKNIVDEELEKYEQDKQNKKKHIDDTNVELEQTDADKQTDSSIQSVSIDINVEKKENQELSVDQTKIIDVQENNPQEITHKNENKETVFAEEKIESTDEKNQMDVEKSHAEHKIKIDVDSCSDQKIEESMTVRQEKEIEESIVEKEVEESTLEIIEKETESTEQGELKEIDIDVLSDEEKKEIKYTAKEKNNQIEESTTQLDKKEMKIEDGSSMEMKSGEQNEPSNDKIIEEISNQVKESAENLQKKVDETLIDEIEAVEKLIVESKIKLDECSSVLQKHVVLEKCDDKLEANSSKETETSKNSNDKIIELRNTEKQTGNNSKINKNTEDSSKENLKFEECFSVESSDVEYSAADKIAVECLKNKTELEKIRNSSMEVNESYLIDTGSNKDKKVAVNLGKETSIIPLVIERIEGNSDTQKIKENLLAEMDDISIDEEKVDSSVKETEKKEDTDGKTMEVDDRISEELAKSVENIEKKEEISTVSITEDIHITQDVKIESLVDTDENKLDDSSENKLDDSSENTKECTEKTSVDSKDSKLTEMGIKEEIITYEIKKEDEGAKGCENLLDSIIPEEAKILEEKSTKAEESEDKGSTTVKIEEASIKTEDTFSTETTITTTEKGEILDKIKTEISFAQPTEDLLCAVEMPVQSSVVSMDKTKIQVSSEIVIELENVQPEIEDSNQVIEESQAEIDSKVNLEETDETNTSSAEIAVSVKKDEVKDDSTNENLEENILQTKSEKQNIPDVEATIIQDAVLKDSSSIDIENLKDEKESDVNVKKTQEPSTENIFRVEEKIQEVGPSTTELVQSSKPLSKVDEIIVKEKVDSIVLTKGKLSEIMITSQKDSKLMENAEMFSTIDEEKLVAQATTKSCESLNIPVQKIVSEHREEEKEYKDERDEENGNKKEEYNIKGVLDKQEAGQEIVPEETMQKQEDEKNVTVVPTEDKKNLKMTPEDMEVIEELLKAKDDQQTEVEIKHDSFIDEKHIESNESQCSSTGLSMVDRKLSTAASNIENIIDVAEPEEICRDESVIAKEEKPIEKDSCEGKKSIEEITEKANIGESSTVEDKVDDTAPLKTNKKEIVKSEDKLEHDSNIVQQIMSKEVAATNKDSDILDTKNIADINSTKISIENSEIAKSVLSTTNIFETVSEAEELLGKDKEKDLDKIIESANTCTEDNKMKDIVQTNEDVSDTKKSTDVTDKREVLIEKIKVIDETVIIEKIIDEKMESAMTTSSEEDAKEDKRNEVKEEVTNLKNIPTGREDEESLISDQKKSEEISELGNKIELSEEVDVKDETNKIIESFTEKKVENILKIHPHDTTRKESNEETRELNLKSDIENLGQDKDKHTDKSDIVDFAKIDGESSKKDDTNVSTILVHSSEEIIKIATIAAPIAPTISTKEEKMIDAEFQLTDAKTTNTFIDSEDKIKPAENVEIKPLKDCTPVNEVKDIIEVKPICEVQLAANEETLKEEKVLCEPTADEEKSRKLQATEDKFGQMNESMDEVKVMEVAKIEEPAKDNTNPIEDVVPTDQLSLIKQIKKENVGVEKPVPIDVTTSINQIDDAKLSEVKSINIEKAIDDVEKSKEESTKETKSEKNIVDMQPVDVKSAKTAKSTKNLINKQSLQNIEAVESSTDVSTTKATSAKSLKEETPLDDITSTESIQSLQTDVPSEESRTENDSEEKLDTSEDISIEEHKVALKRDGPPMKPTTSTELESNDDVKDIDIEDLKNVEENAIKEDKRVYKRVKAVEEAKTSEETLPAKVIKSSPEAQKEEPKRMSRRLRGAAIEETKTLDEVKPVKDSPKEETKRGSKRLKVVDKSVDEIKVDEAISKKAKLEEIKPDAVKKILSPVEKKKSAGPKCSKRLEAKRAMEKSINSSSEIIDLDSDEMMIAESSNNQVTTSSEIETIVIDDTSRDKSEQCKARDLTIVEQVADSAVELQSNRNSPDVQIIEAETNVEEELVKAALEASFDDDCKLIEESQEKPDNASQQKVDDALLKAAEDSLKRSNQDREELALIQAAQESQKRENDALIQAANEAENNRRITRSKEEYKKPLNIVVETHSQEISIVKEAESTTTEDNEPSTTDNKQVEYSSKISKNSSQLKLTIRKNKTEDSSILKIYDPKETGTVEKSPSESETEVEESPIPKLIIKQSQCSPKILSPLKITIKPVMKPEEQTQKASPKLIIKPIIKPDEDIKEEKHHSPKITIKPIPKPVDDGDRCHSPKITIKPLIKPTEASISPKIKIKPIVKPEEIKEETEERIVLKITKGNIPQQKEVKKDETEKLAKIKLKFSKEGGHAHIVNEEKGGKRIIDEPEPEAKKLRVEPINPPTENIPLAEANTPKSAPKNLPIETPTKPESFTSPPPEIPKPEASPEIVITPTPRKRGRPRKVPLEVREEFKDPKEEEPSEASPEGISGRPKRSCRGPSARTTLGIKPRKPRGAGRARGRGRGSGARGNRSDSPSPKKEKITESKLKLLKEAAITAHVTDFLENQDVEMKLSNTIIIEDSCDGKIKEVDEFLAKPADVVMYEEETRMSADSRAQTPAKHVVNLEGVEESQSSVHSSVTTESSKLKKGTRLEVHQDHEGAVVHTPEQLAEYYWGGRGPYMLQEQVAQFLGIKSFKRKYPGISRRTVDMQERDFIRESGLASEHMCDLGLTAVHSADILDIMYSDFQFKYEEYCKHQRDRQTKDITNKQKALSLAASQEKNKLDITQAAVESAAQWNANFNKARKEERIACMDLQTFTINYPKGRAKQLNRPKIGNYPISLVPGQYTDYYKTFTPTELNNLPLNTMLYKPINITNDEDSQSDGSGSESDSSSSGSDSSDSDSSDEDCNICSPGSAVASKKAVV